MPWFASFSAISGGNNIFKCSAILVQSNFVNKWKKLITLPVVYFFFKLDVWCAINALIIRKFKKNC